MKYLGIICIQVISIFFAHGVIAQTAPAFGDAQTFAVLGSSTVTNTGNTVVSGDLGISPGSAVTGFGPGVINFGQMYSGAGSRAGAAQASAHSMFNTLMGATSATTTDLTGQVLGQTPGAITLSPGIYKFSSSAQITGTLILDDSADPNGIFIFQIGSTLTTASYSKVIMKSGGTGQNVFWQIGSSATIGTYTSFSGNILALTSITMTTGATTTGKLFALNAAVTMDTNNVDQIRDSDGDGVPDNLDDYPLDPTLAFNNFSAPAGTTIAFEDLWPDKGDFDMNDLVMAYKYNIITNAQNNVARVVGTYTLLATGGIKKNSFGVEFPIPATSVSSVDGAKLEGNQTNVVIILFTNMRDEIQYWNTYMNEPKSPTKEYKVEFSVSNGPALSQFGTDYNPFIINYSGNSRREVHLGGKAPTSLADRSVFGTSDDNSNLQAGQYYISKDGLPFAITVPISSFVYPIEKINITTAYTHFADWAISGGVNFQDWLWNTGPGYRNQNNMYIK